MIRVIVVEDEEKYQKNVKDVIAKISFELDLDYKISFFKKMDPNLLKEIKDTEGNKIYILDIELEGNDSGIKIAELIRKDDWDSEIIFITNHDKMFETVYRNVYNVFDFIEKFNDFDLKLEKDIKKIIKMNFDNKMFVYKTRNIDLHIYYRNILYIYRDNSERKLVIVTPNNSFMVSFTMAEMMKNLDKRFRICHRACILNIEHVEEYNWNKGYFILDNKKMVHMLSKKYKKDIIE